MKQTENEILYQRLLEYSGSDYYPFHMPGHKRNPMFSMEDPVRYDITEITDFDNLHHSEGILKREQAYAAQLYGAAESFYLINGSSAGILAAVSACVRRGGRLLLCRNAHKSAYNAAYLRQLQLFYLYPEEHSLGFSLPVTPQMVQSAIQDVNGIEAVFITSPAYEGVVSDIRGIVRVAHEAGLPVIVDEAHGAHLGFHPYFPEAALSQGADIVIQSMHKTLPSLTQTALLHVGSKARYFVDIARLRQFLAIYQTSSPSYVFMGGMAKCLHSLNREQFELFAQKLQQFYKKCGALQFIHVLDAGDEDCQGSGPDGGNIRRDLSKIIIYTDNRLLDGQALFDLFRDKYHLEFEMAAPDYVLGMTSVCDTQEGFDRLFEALAELDGMLKEKLSVLLKEREKRGEENTFVKSKEFETESVFAKQKKSGTENTFINTGAICTIADAIDLKKREIIDLKDCAGRVSAEYIYCYPPGTPVIVPGERIRETDLEYIAGCLQKGINMQGLKDNTFRHIEVVME